jgi:zinc protease
MKKFIPIMLFLVLAAVSSPLLGQDIPARPEQLIFSPLDYTAPDPVDFRDSLENGIPVYIAEDNLLPLATIQVQFKGGKYLEEPGKEGLASLTSKVWRTGGAGDMGPAELDEELAFLAADLGVNIGNTGGSISLQILSKDFDRGLELLMKILLEPRFNQDRLDKAKSDLIAAIKQRNDDPGSIERMEWNRLLYGENYWLNHLAVQSSVESITRENLVQFRERLINDKSMVIAFAGNISKDEVKAKLNRVFSQVPALAGPGLPEVPQPETTAEPGVYLVHKEGVNQARVLIGHLGIKEPFADEFAMELGNDVLGGSGFTSWIMSKIRSDMGLAYSAGSLFSVGTDYPGQFRGYFQTKFSTCAIAAQVLVDQVNRLRDEGVASEELETSRNSAVQTLPSRFESLVRTMSVFTRDELSGRPMDYWPTYISKINQVTEENIRETALKNLDPDKLIILVVGNAEEVLKINPDFPDASLEKLGKVTRLPLRDPLTLEPIDD